MKLHRTLFCAAALAGAAVLDFPVAAQAQSAMPGMGPVAALEAQSWENIKTGKFDAMYAMWAPEFVYSGPQDIGGREQSIAGLKGCTMHAYTLGSATYRMIGKDAVLVSYPATVDTDCGPTSNPTHFSGDMNCTSTWVKRDGKWLELAHTNAIAVKMPPPPKAQ